MFIFDEYIERCYSDSRKWQKYAGKDVIPLWLADTDFRSPSCIIESLHSRIKHGVFGYGSFLLPLIEVFIERMDKYYQWKIQPEWLIFIPGVVSGLYLAVRTLTAIDEVVIVPSPIYPPFRAAVKNSNRQQCFVPMALMSNRWCMNLTDINSRILRKSGMLMLCNPHNPGGTVYCQKELEQYLIFAQKNDLLVCSDEIHCDLLLTPNKRHIPFASLNEEAAQCSITLMSPSKTFNIAGLGIAIAIIPNLQLRMNFITQRTGIVSDVNILAFTAAYSALKNKQAQIWLLQQLYYLKNNRDYTTMRINDMPGLSMVCPDATYLAWIDASDLIKNKGIVNPQNFFENAGVGLSSGRDFGDNNFIRLNFGCNRILLKKALDRMALACK